MKVVGSSRDQSTKNALIACSELWCPSFPIMGIRDFMALYASTQFSHAVVVKNNDKNVNAGVITDLSRRTMSTS